MTSKFSLASPLFICAAVLVPLAGDSVSGSAGPVVAGPDAGVVAARRDQAFLDLGAQHGGHRVGFRFPFGPRGKRVGVDLERQG